MISLTTHRVCPFVVALVSGFCWLAGPLAGPVRAAEPETKQTAQAEATAEVPVKVGVLVSNYTATGESWTGQPYGYAHAGIAQKLRHPSVELFPIIEPDTQEDENQKKVLEKHFKGTPPLLATDDKALRRLDVIVLNQSWNLHEDVVDAIHGAVSDGVGLLVVSAAGVVNPGFTAEITDLHGMTQAQYMWHPKPQQSTVISPSSLFPQKVAPNDAQEATRDWKFPPNGVAGRLKEGALPLVQLDATAQVGYPKGKIDMGEEGKTIYTLYISRLGRGAIVVCGWMTWVEPPAVINMATTDQPFYMRCVHRLRQAKLEAN